MDLNVIIEEDGIRDSEQVIRQKVERCRALGFQTIALSVVFELPKNGMPNIPAPPETTVFNDGRFKIYTRLTVKVEESLQLHQLSKRKPNTKYDLLAFEPQNEKMLMYMTSGSAELDILTFDMKSKLNYNLFKTSFTVLEKRGVCIEINYGPAQLGSSLRRNIICNGQNLVEKTTKNLIISSGVTDAFRLRGPQDAKHIGSLFLLPPVKCHEAVFKNGLTALNVAKCRNNPSAAAIQKVEQIPGTTV